MVTLDGDEYLTVDEAAGLLGVKRATLYAYVSRGSSSPLAGCRGRGRG